MGDAHSSPSAFRVEGIGTDTCQRPWLGPCDLWFFLSWEVWGLSCSGLSPGLKLGPPWGGVLKTGFQIKWCHLSAIQLQSESTSFLSPVWRPHLCLWDFLSSVSQNSWPFLEAGYDFRFPRLGWMWHFHPSLAWWCNGVSNFWDAVPWPHGEVPPSPGARPQVLPSHHSLMPWSWSS